ncbi:MAG: hypothetical protein GXW99_00530, partial [Clostridiales bacterium]|nr:hypothetical protein [Clostridiales bacterium]
MAYQEVTEGQWLIPQGSGEFFIFPSRDRWPEIIKANQKRTETRWVADLRQRVRKQVLDAAISYTQNVLGDYAIAAQWAQPDLQQPILVTGHQPLFYHPGVWCKNFVLAQAAQELGAIPINLIVDTDEVGTLEVMLPIFRAGSWSTEQITLLEANPGETFEVLAAPTKEQISAFLAAIRQVNTAGYQESARENLARFIALLEKMNGQHWAEDLGLAGWQALLRRRYEGQAPYLELPVSHLAELPGFKEYAAQVIAAAPSFVECYNRTLRRYRHKHNYRYPVNPFPDLQYDATINSYELPFWVL